MKQEEKRQKDGGVVFKASKECRQKLELDA